MRSHTDTDRLLVFTKLPLPGQVKTRLAEDVGTERAARVHAGMVALTLRETRTLAASDGTRVDVRVDASPRRSRSAFGRWRRLTYRTQGDGDLGSRLERGFAEALAAGANRVCAIGTDCPGLDAERLRDAFAALEANDVVLGPASDGGYYLIGMCAERSELPSALFRGIPWSTDAVFATTIQRARDAGATVAVLPELPDVDTAADLVHLERIRAARLGPPRTISVIVVARNEEDRIGATLDRVTGHADVDVTLVDGGSTDATRELARASGARVVEERRGRADQLSLGAAGATGDALLFLHADTLLPDGWPDEVRRILAQPGLVLGAFRFATDSPRPVMRLLEFGTNARARRGLPYGDQAHFIRATDYRSLGGIPHLPIMEDYEFARRARLAGRVEISPLPAVTSARRWEEHGPLAWTALNIATAIRYELGASAADLARWRRRLLARKA